MVVNNMSCYICEKCGTIENTACGGYWKNKLHKEPPMCSQCNYGEWHGQFEKNHWSIYSVKELIDMEERNDGSMLNARDYFIKNGIINDDKLKEEDDN